MDEYDMKSQEQAGSVTVDPNTPDTKPIEPEVVDKPHHITDEMVLQALRECGGFRSVAASKLGVSPSAISKRLTRNPKLKEAVEDAELRMLDLAQNELVKKVKAGHAASIFFVLKCKGGWIEKTQVQLSADEMPPPVTFVLPPIAAIQAAKDATRAMRELPISTGVPPLAKTQEISNE